VKAFSFPLQQALRWRETQVTVQKVRLAVAAGRAVHANAILESQKAELAGESKQVTQGSTRTALLAYAAWAERSRARIRESQERSVAAQQAATGEMHGLVEANRGARLLENLKESGEGAWRRQFDRELSAFADEAFLSRLQSKKRTGA
jgi:hypothetical protein